MKTYMGENEGRIESVILTIYVLYTVVMAVVSYIQEWGTWVPWVICIGMLISVYLHVANVRDYRFRAFFTAIMAWLNFVVDAIFTNDLFSILSTMVCMIILLSIYCIPEIIYVTLVGSTIILLYHGIVNSCFNFSTVKDGSRSILQIASIYIAEYVLYYLIRIQVERRQILIETIEDLKKAEQSKDDFMANVSHEIRTPINTVCGISETILGEKLSETVRHDILGIQTAGRNLLTVVNDILDFSELQSGKMTLVEDTYNITSTMNDIMNMTFPRINDKKLEMIVDCDIQIPCGLIGDEQKIRRVITNLIDNAVKYTNEGGILVRVTTRKEDYGVNLSVTIKDTGIGMDDQTIENLFSKYNQVDTRRNRQEGGIGLGLAIAQALVSKMGGFITVNGELGKGSEATFVIPQKVEDDRPIISIKKAEEVRVLEYINMDKYSFSVIREGYSQSIQRMVEQMGIFYHHCSNLMEFKRRIEKEHYTHVFISWLEYQQDSEYFTKLSNKLKVALILDRNFSFKVTSNILRIYKPFYVLSIAAVLNGEKIHTINGIRSINSGFTAPDASVLVVDDNSMNLRVVEGLLRPYKIKVYTADSGKAALKKVDCMNFDLIFMDHMMPEMDGVETFHCIRKKTGQYFQKVPIVALTANAIGGAREMFLNEGFNDFVAKPIELSALERVLRKMLPQNKIINIFEDNDTELEEQVKSVSLLDGLDIDRGINCCGGSLKDYVDVTGIFYTDAPTRMRKMREAYENKNWKLYEIHAHALKSTSSSIGADDLSDAAKDLETAARNEDEDYIQRKQEIMFQEYERVVRMIKNTPLFNIESKETQQEER